VKRGCTKEKRAGKLVIPSEEALTAAPSPTERERAVSLSLPMGKTNSPQTRERGRRKQRGRSSKKRPLKVKTTEGDMTNRSTIAEGASRGNIPRGTAIPSTEDVEDEQAVQSTAFLKVYSLQTKST
jgi:hypothetical protein